MITARSYQGNLSRLLVALSFIQNTIYPLISVLPSPPPANAQESPPQEATHSAEPPAPSPLEPILLDYTLFTSSTSAQTNPPETIPEASPSAKPEGSPEPSILPSPHIESSTPSPTTSPPPSSTPVPSVSPDTLSPTVLDTEIPDYWDTGLPSPFSISLSPPFAGFFPISYNFGELSDNNYVSYMQSLFSVSGHDGIDYALPKGTPVLSAALGQVVFAGSGDYGNTVIIKHSWGTSYYGHLESILVNKGDTVSPKQMLGLSGQSGITTGPHLHFGIKPNNARLNNGYHGMIDPNPYFLDPISPAILGTKNGKTIHKRPQIHQIKNKFSLQNKSLKNDDTNIIVNFAHGESSDLNIVLKNPKGFELDISDQILGTFTGPLGPSLDVNLAKVVNLVPGQYELTITDSLGNYDTQDFTWGVLAINTNKTVYLPQSTVDFSMAVLDNQGDMVCDAQVDLSITAPSGEITRLSSKSGEVTVNLVTCLSKTYTLNPDYQSSYHPTEIGKYQVEMTATTADGARSIGSSFMVQTSVPFDIERVTITRIYPRLDYPVILRIHAFEDYVGSVEDIIPANFELIKPSGDTNPEYTVTSRGDNQVLTWNVVWQKGHDYVLAYQFNPPDKSPDFYTLGPLKIGNRFSEIKKWQLAIDVTTTVILNYAHTILTSGTTWTVPADWTDSDNTIEVIGGGGAGRTDTTGAAGAGGGGGGAYAKSVNIDLTPGGTVDYQIGQGGIPTSVNGTDTFFNRTSGTAGTCADTTSACAKGGTGATSATGASGGTAASSFATGTGNVKNNGGTGGTGNTTSDSGGGGGGAGGPNGAGGTGGAGDTDNATDGVGGGGGGNGGGNNGGSGITSDTVGANGGNGNGGTGGGTGGSAADGANGTANTGGGGGGGADNFDGGNGANGNDLVSGANVGSGGGGGGTGDTATTTGMGGNGGLYGGGGGGGRYGGFGAPGVIIITYNGNTPTKSTWVVPSDWNSSDNTITAIGGGGAGVSAAQGTGAAGGGGGGYSKTTNLSLTVGANIDYQVGAGGSKTTVGAGNGTAGTASFFNRTAGTAGTCADTVSVCANPGSAGSGTTGGGGGSTTGADGSTLLAGGAGGAGNSTGDTGGGGGGAGGTAVGQVGGAGSSSTSGGGGGGGGAGGTSSGVGQAGQTTTGGTGGVGPAGTGGGTAGNAGHGGAGSSATGGGGGGGDDVFGGGNGGSGSSTTYGGGGGGGAGDNNTAATSAAYGGHGGLHGGGGGGGLTNGFGAEGIIIITYTPALITISGTANGNNGATVKWAKNGSVQAETATISSSAWTLSALASPPTSGDIITVWVDGVTDANESTAVTKWSTGSVTGMVLDTNVVTIGSNQDQSLSLTDLNGYDCTEDEDIMYQAASSHLKIEGDACAGSTTNTYTAENLEILSGDTLAVATSETLTTYDLTITGTLASSGNSTYNVSHNWAKTGTFTSSTSTVNLTGADSSTQTLSGSTSFNNLTVSTSSNSAGRTITHTAGTTQTVTGTWTITGYSGKVITLGSSAASSWTINPTAATVTYASISYSTNIGVSFCAINSTNGGNNTSWDISSGSSCIPATANSFQRKTWYDGTRYWRSFYDTPDNRVEFEYSADGSSWTENTSARISISTNDFSIEADASNLFIVYTASNDIKGRAGTSYPGTGFGWGTEQVVLNGSGSSDDFSFATIERDSSNYVWVAARYTGTGVYFPKTIKEAGGTNDLPEDSADTIYAINNLLNTSSKAISTIAPLTSQDMYLTFALGTSVNGCKWVNASSDWRDASSNSCVINPSSYNGLVGYWQMNENTGTTIEDSSINSNTATQVGNAGWGTGQYGAAATFDGTGDSLSIGSPTALDDLSAMTISVWIKPTDAGESSYGRILDKSSSNAPADGYEMDMNFGTMYFGASCTSGLVSRTPGTSASYGVWQHLVVTWDGSGTGTNINWYVNGSLSNGSTSDCISGSPTTNAAQNFIIGNSTANNRSFNGLIDDVRIYNRVLNSTEVSTLYAHDPTILTRSDSIGTSTSDLYSSISSVGDTSGNVHLTFINSSGNTMYSERTSSWQTAVTLDSNTTNSYPTISYNTNGNDLYAFWVRADDIFYKKGISTYASGNWDTTATSWQTSGTNTYVSSNYSGSDKIFAQWYNGSTIGWDQLNIGNTVPNSPTSLAQKTTGDVTITTGSWHNTTSIKFTATATDTDNPDTLYLCIEKDLLGVSFSNTEDSCGSGVSYTGSGVTVTHTIASQTDDSEYHWQARIKDAAGAYSAWVSYDVNAESARDYGLDSSAPSGGTIYDGTSAGVDTNYSDSSLSALSANWASFNSNVSGLNKYQYSIGTTAGATDIKTWTDNSTTTSVTSTGLTLQTNQLYYFNVRAIDNAGNTGSTISSNGQLVAPSISFSISPATLTFANLNVSNSYTDTQNTTLTTSTNAYNGYVIRAFATDYLRSTTGGFTIGDFSGGTYASPATWSGSETGYGYTSSDTTIQGANKFGTGTLYAPFSQTAPGDIIADHTSNVSGTPISAEQFTITHKVKVASTQASHKYQTTTVYTATAQY